MGIILEAKCPCGYDTNIKADRGRNPKTIFYAPLLCETCGIVTSSNYYMQDPTCFNCKKEGKFYDDKSLHAPGEKSKKLALEINREGKKFELADIHYFCPKCKEFKLRFEDIGNWD